MLRYEDFVERPQRSVRRILDLVGEAAFLLFVSERGIRFGVNHNIGGNPTRFQTETVQHQCSVPQRRYR